MRPMQVVMLAFFPVTLVWLGIDALVARLRKR